MRAWASDCKSKATNTKTTHARSVAVERAQTMFLLLLPPPPQASLLPPPLNHRLWRHFYIVNLYHYAVVFQASCPARERCTLSYPRILADVLEKTWHFGQIGADFTIKKILVLT